MGSFVDEAQARVAKEVKLPEGYYMTWGGEFENQRRAMKRLSVIVPISILVIFVLLYLTFQRGAAGDRRAARSCRSRRWAACSRSTSRTRVLSVSAAVGFITLFGVAVMDGVLLITYVRQAREQHARTARTPSSSAVVAAAAAGADDGAAGVARPAAGGDCRTPSARTPSGRSRSSSSAG